MKEGRDGCWPPNKGHKKLHCPAFKGLQRQTRKVFRPWDSGTEWIPLCVIDIYALVQHL